MQKIIIIHLTPIGVILLVMVEIALTLSQILYAGGAPMDTTGSYTWYYNNMNDRAPA